MPDPTSTLTSLLADWPEGRDLGSRLAAGLLARGVERGDRVAWQLPNDRRVIALYRACWRMGAVAVPIHARAGERERDDLVEMVGAITLLGSLDALDELAEEGASCSTTDALVDEASPDDVAVILFTAGSTGTPKGVRHTHRTLGYKAELMVDVHGLGPSDVVLMPAPLAHISGLLNAVLVAGVAGMRALLMDRWSPADALELIERERVTFMVGPPTFFVDLMDCDGFSGAAVSSLRLISSGGAGVSPAFVERARIELGAEVKRSYGSTEAPTVASSVAEDDPVRSRDHDGHAIGEAALRVVEGELQVRGPELFVGYLSEDETSAAMTEDGWFRTGDTADLDDEGWLTITGRVKDLIIRGGENISMAEVEGVLEAHPAVVQAGVVGEPDPRLGERVVAFVVATAPFDLEACQAWFAEQGVARFKTPERVVVLDELPRLPAGKLDRVALRALL